MGLKPVFFFILLLKVSDLSSAPGSSSTIGCCREPNLRIRADPQLQTGATTPMQASQIFFFLSVDEYSKHSSSIWSPQVFAVSLVSGWCLSQLCWERGWHCVAISETATTSLTPPSHFNVYYLKKYECPLLSNFLHFSSGRSGVHPLPAIFLLPHDERLCPYFTVKELDSHWRKKEKIKMKKL